MDYIQVIDAIYHEVRQMENEGKVADYIPVLAKVNADKYGIAIATIDGETYGIGDYQENFSIQSISKVFSLAMVVRLMGNELWKYVGREPSGTPFNSLVQLEYEKGIPRNPLINAGALVVTDKLMDQNVHPKDSILNFIRSVADNEDIYFNAEIAQSEYGNASRNYALAHLMKSFGNIRHDIDALLDVYCHQCSISMNCLDLAKSFLFLANRGVNPWNKEEVLTMSRAKRLSALMLTCGFYDESGDFAFRVGLPGKSGVGGGIVAIIPGKLSIAVWSPVLNPYGNSFRGIETLERFTTDIGISIF